MRQRGSPANPKLIQRQLLGTADILLTDSKLSSHGALAHFLGEKRGHLGTDAKLFGKFSSHGTPPRLREARKKRGRIFSDWCGDTTEGLSPSKGEYLAPNNGSSHLALSGSPPVLHCVQQALLRGCFRRSC